MKKLIRKSSLNVKAKHYYLDTSIQVKRILGHSKHRKYIEEKLAQRRVYSSYFAFREFRQSIIVPLIKFYFILKEEDNLDDAIAIFSDLSRGNEPKAVMPLLKKTEKYP